MVAGSCPDPLSAYAMTSELACLILPLACVATSTVHYRYCLTELHGCQEYVNTIECTCLGGRGKRGERERKGVNRRDERGKGGSSNF